VIGAYFNLTIMSKSTSISASLFKILQMSCNLRKPSFFENVSCFFYNDFSYFTRDRKNPLFKFLNNFYRFRFSKTFVISTEMQQIGHKKVIHHRIRDKICNPLDYMRITFPFEPLKKIGFLRIYFFNQFSESLNLPRHSFLRRL
jgi:hypothetical protein